MPSRFPCVSGANHWDQQRTAKTTKEHSNGKLWGLHRDSALVSQKLKRESRRRMLVVLRHLKELDLPLHPGRYISSLPIYTGWKLLGQQHDVLYSFG